MLVVSWRSAQARPGPSGRIKLIGHSELSMDNRWTIIFSSPPIVQPETSNYEAVNGRIDDSSSFASAPSNGGQRL